MSSCVAAGPERALINVAQIDESRILMAPLAAEVGGWRQIPGYASKTDPTYTKMAALVDRCMVRSTNENTPGWQPTLEAGGGERWIMEACARFLSLLEDASPLD